MSRSPHIRDCVGTVGSDWKFRLAGEGVIALRAHVFPGPTEPSPKARLSRARETQGFWDSASQP